MMLSSGARFNSDLKASGHTVVVPPAPRSPIPWDGFASLAND